MPTTIETTVYTYDELSDDAKEKARDWYRGLGLDYDWWDGNYEDFNSVGAILGLDIDLSKTYFTGFYSQGDGSSFTADYAYVKGMKAAIREYAPKDKILHDIADRIAEAQKNLFYGATGYVKPWSGRSYLIEVDLYDQNGNDFECAIPALTYLNDNAQAIVEAIEDLNGWFYRQLEKQYEYLTSDEAIAETIVSNEYTFTEDGRRFG